MNVLGYTAYNAIATLFQNKRASGPDNLYNLDNFDNFDTLSNLDDLDNLDTFDSLFLGLTTFFLTCGFSETSLDLRPINKMSYILCQVNIFIFHRDFPTFHKYFIKVCLPSND